MGFASCSRNVAILSFQHNPLLQCARHSGCRSTQRRLIEAPQLSAVKSFTFALQEFEGLDTNTQMLADGAFVKCVCLSRKLQFTMQWLVGDAEQGAVWYAKTVALSRDGCRLHVDCDCPALIET